MSDKEIVSATYVYISGCMYACNDVKMVQYEKAELMYIEKIHICIYVTLCIFDLHYLTF